MQVKQIVNLFKLMDFFIESRKPLSIRDIVDEFGWPRSSAFNVITTLMEQGYLYQSTPRGGYLPTAKWLELGQALLTVQPLPDSVHQLLVDLAHLTGETIFLAAAEGTQVVFLDVEESSSDIRFIARIGQRLPIHITAAGKAILAQYSTRERKALLSRIEYTKFTEHSLVSMDAVLKDIEQGEERGWHVNPGMYNQSVAGIAVPFSFLGRRYAIALGAPLSRVGQSFDHLGSLLQNNVKSFLAQHAEK